MIAFKTHNDEHIETNMSSLSGHCSTTRETLVKCFGEPLQGSGDGKVTTSWELKVTTPEGTGVITIYDWKEYDNSADSANFDRWHVGGYSSDDSKILNKLISQQTKLLVN